MLVRRECNFRILSRARVELLFICQHPFFLSCQHPGGGRQEPGNISVSFLSSRGTQPATSIDRNSASFVDLLLLCWILQGNLINPTANQIPAAGKIWEIIRFVSKDSWERVVLTQHGLNRMSELSGIRVGNLGWLPRPQVSFRILWEGSRQSWNTNAFHVSQTSVSLPEEGARDQQLLVKVRESNYHVRLLGVFILNHAQILYRR